MTEVVTNAAASLQPYLQANRLQAFGVDQPDPTASDQAAVIAAGRIDVALQAAQVAQPSGDRSALQDNSAGSGFGGGFAPSPGTSSGGTLGPDPSQAAAQTTGPAKAVVTVQVVNVAGDSSGTQQAPTPIQASVLNAAEDLTDSDEESIAEDVIGTEFAPMQMLVAPGPRSPGQKDIIFDGRKLFGGQVPQSPAPVVVTTGSGVAAAASGTFAAAAEAAQQSFAPSSDGTDTSFSTDTRTFYQRAQAVADTLGTKAPSNPGVKQLFSDLALYSGAPATAPTVTVTA